jgi:hydrophobe/amphiphile efflux-1 (HAE1) family protein
VSLATWSIRHPIPTVLGFALLTFAGIWGFARLPVQALPEIELPAVVVTLAQPGAAPAQLETEVARKVEDSIATLDGVKHQRTTISDGAVSVSVEFVLGKSPSDALIETKNAVDRIRSDLPDDLLQPTVETVVIAGEPILGYAVASSRLDEVALSWFVDDTLARRVLAVPGVGRFERVGGVTREVRVEVDPVRLAALRVTAADVSRALRQMQQESSGGTGRVGGAEQSVRTIATVRTASELSAWPIALPDGRRLRLDQIATVRDGAADRRQVALLDGEPVVGFRVYRARGHDDTRIAEGVAAAVAQLTAHDATLQAQLVYDRVDYTRQQYAGSMRMLVEGALLAVLVVFAFLRDWRATFVAALALPLSILPTFAAMYWLGYSLNMLTLLALAVIVGVLVDDAIVEVENIARHRRPGKPLVEAVADAVDEIALAVVATTLALVVVFLPTALMSGVPGLFFRQFGWTAVVAVLMSLLVARALTPMLAALVLKPSAHAEHAGVRFTHGYLAAVRWCLAHRGATLAGATLFLALSLALVPWIPTGFVPASDRGYTTLTVELPPGSSLAQTQAAVEAARTGIAGVDGVARVFATVGATSGNDEDAQAAEVRRGSLVLTFAPREARDSQTLIEHRIREKLANVAGARFALSSGAPGERFSLILTGDDANALKTSAQAIERELRGVPGLSNVTSSASLERPEIVIRPDTRLAAERGITAAAIGDTLRIATSGDFDAQMARLNVDSRQLPVRVRLPDAALHDLPTLANLRVPGREGLVPLSTIATVAVESGPAQIERYDRRRYVMLSADLGGSPLGPAVEAVKALPSVAALPSSVRLVDEGDAELAAELSTGFSMAIVVGLICVFCVLAVLFNDFLQPLTILSAIPLSLGGAFVALLIGDSELDVPALIGLVMLMGIVSKNSILLVEYAVLGMRERGLSAVEAAIDACAKRARPIVMTSLAMIAGMAPIALGLGPDASFRQPMAIAVTGGLVTSTALSLLVVPVVFVCVDGFRRRYTRTFRKPAHTPAVVHNSNY